jgi:hypothetical protein
MVPRSFNMGQHNRFFAILHEFGLTPGDLDRATR